MKLLRKIRNMVLPKPVNEQERRIEAEIAFRTQERNFKRYSTELNNSIAHFKELAYEAEQNGQHANALRAARFTRLLTATREKIEGVMQHFDLLRTLNGVGDMMVEFMNACSTLGCDLSEQIDVQALGQGEINMEKGLQRLAFMSDKVEQAFEMITSGMKDPDAGITATVEDEAFLKDIMGENEPAIAESAPTIAEPAPAVAKPSVELPAAVAEVPAEVPSAIASSLSALKQKLEDARS